MFEMMNDTRGSRFIHVKLTCRADLELAPERISGLGSLAPRQASSFQRNPHAGAILVLIASYFVLAKANLAI